MISFDKLFDFKNSVFRNIQHIDLDAFDDLSKNAKAKAFARKSASKSHFNKNNLQYHAIDFIFEKQTWLPTRFGNGNYPVWYGSLDLKTSFYETLYHWQRTFLEAPQGFVQSIAEPISIFRTVFTVNCQAALIDLRDKTKKHKALIDPNPAHYSETQQLGQKMNREGFPGLISQSARNNSGEIIAVFKKEILSNPNLFQHYCYEYDIQLNKKTVKQVGDDKIVFRA